MWLDFPSPVIISRSFHMYPLGPLFMWVLTYLRRTRVSTGTGQFLKVSALNIQCCTESDHVLSDATLQKVDRNSAVFLNILELVRANQKPCFWLHSHNIHVQQQTLCISIAFTPWEGGGRQYWWVFFPMYEIKIFSLFLNQNRYVFCMLQHT